MKVKKYLTILIWISSIFFTLPAWAAGDGNSQGGPSTSLSIKSYDPTKVEFHSYGHLSRWYNSPLAGQDPHLWTGVIAFFCIVAGFTGYKMWKDRNGRRQHIETVDDLLSSMEAREQRLLAKINQLEAQIKQGQVTEQESKVRLNQYEGELTKVRLQIQKRSEQNGK